MITVLQMGLLVHTFPAFPKSCFLVLEVVSAVYNFPQEEAAVFLRGVLSGLLSFKVWGSLVKAQNLS